MKSPKRSQVPGINASSVMRMAFIVNLQELRYLDNLGDDQWLVSPLKIHALKTTVVIFLGCHFFIFFQVLCQGFREGIHPHPETNGKFAVYT